MSKDSLRSLPRVFVPGAKADAPIDLPQEELDKLRKVLRLSSGDPIGVLPNDGTLIRCELKGRQAIPVSVERPDTEAKLRLTLAQALPKGDRLETVVRMGTEIGVARFLLFPSDRTVVKWEPGKLASKLKRLQTIVREAAEQSYRTLLPDLSTAKDLEEVLSGDTAAVVLSEVEEVPRSLTDALHCLPTSTLPPLHPPSLTLVVGPEGGWSPRELGLIGDRGVTLGPRVLRTDTAGVVAEALVLLGTV